MKPISPRSHRLRRTNLLARQLASVSLVALCALATTGAHAAVRYTFTTLNNQTDPTFNQLLGINDNALIAGYYGSGATGHPNKGYLLSPPYGQRNYTNENMPNSVQTQVTGLNDSGTTVGFFANTNQGSGDANTGFYNTGGPTGTYSQVVNPHTPNIPGEVNQLLGVNNQNVAVGFYNDANGSSHGYTFNTKTLTFSADINAPNATSTTTTAINDYGQLAGFATVGSLTEAFLDHNGHFGFFEIPGSTNTEFFGLNDYGVAVGDYVTAQGTTIGIVFNTKTFTWVTLQAPRANGMTVVNGINNHDDVVGFYLDGAGNTNGFLATPSATPAPVSALASAVATAPEPSTWALMVLGFCGLGYASRARRRKVAIA
ncbi:putative secreted protein with PEP-CTERM sorting signal [Roseiarcus fermentans]|uniref:Putative secreted protein with PEP-CTERM sorting signal n=1 Tax=Roseiarcus fermentans TaxID=1473586 RepID=A0A366EU92_9HYPH|nr:PEP-CTERM sorting domain-containing protein [Roseiarcus fermentans]RBP05065.1 putative secreted protein with PEP-CTERM sorting signal [Roseiarcus fermentans]